MSDLPVDLGALQAAATGLRLLIHEFDAAEDDAAEDIASGAGDVLGSPRVASGGMTKLAEATDMAGKVDQAVPGVVRIKALSVLLLAGRAATGAGTYSVGIWGARTGYHDLWVDPRSGRSTDDGIALTSQHYTCPAVPLP